MAAAMALAVLTAIRLIVAACVPLSPDEAYYWVWSRALAPGYLDHPPMVALWIRAGTSLAGDSAFGIRLLGPLFAAVGSVLLVQATQDLLPGQRAGILAAALLNATLVLGIGAVIMTPDTPLLFFWTATLWALGRLVRTGNGAWWLMAGAMAGLAMASKYTAALLIASVFLWLLLLPQTRVWLRRPYPWAGALVAALIFAPVIWWNAAHGWASFIKQGGRTGDWQPARALTFLGELIGGQFGLATPLIFLLCVGGVWTMTRQAMRRHDAGTALLAVVTLLPAAVFVQHAFGDRVQGNWPAIIYPSACIAAAALCSRWWRPAVALGFVMTGAVYVHAATALPHLPPRIDPSARLLAGWPGLAGQVNDALAQAGGSFVAADDYGTAALLARDLPRSVPVIGAEPRWRFFNLETASATMAGRAGILIRSARRHDPPDARPWAELAPLGMAARRSGSMVAEDYVLYRVIGRPGAATALLPHRENEDEPAHP
jgi:4-amino-4-deoxy-L-arabinose transferase-like glycosyltransferase